MNYKEQLKHPRWQKCRLELLNQANWQCWSCGNTEKTLHVHHKTYEKGKDVWDYPDSNFIVLCEDCHKLAHNILKNDARFTDAEVLQFAYDRLVFLDESKIQMYMQRLNLIIYETAKRSLPPLPPDEYEKAVKKLAEKYGV